MSEYQHTIDAKGRVIFPAKFREQLGQVFVATKGLDNCLFIFAAKEWSALEERLQQLPMASKDARTYARFFFSRATELECDKLGRVVLPAALREHAGLTKEITVIGVGNRVEIWDSQRWQKYNEESDEAVNGIAEQLAGLGI